MQAVALIKVVCGAVCLAFLGHETAARDTTALAQAGRPTKRPAIAAHPDEGRMGKSCGNVDVSARDHPQFANGQAWVSRKDCEDPGKGRLGDG